MKSIYIFFLHIILANSTVLTLVLCLNKKHEMVIESRAQARIGVVLRIRAPVAAVSASFGEYKNMCQPVVTCHHNRTVCSSSPHCQRRYVNVMCLSCGCHVSVTWLSCGCRFWIWYVWNKSARLSTAAHGTVIVVVEGCNEGGREGGEGGREGGEGG